MKQLAPLPQLRPIEQRPGRGRRRDGEQSEDGDRRPSCFGGQLFGGCQICTVDDDDIHIGRGFERLRETWISLDTEAFCSTHDRRKAGVNDLIEEAEESTVGGEDSSLEGDGTSVIDDCHQSSVAKAASSVPWHARSADEERIQQELAAVMKDCGDLFTAQGWNLVHVSGERYMLNGRTIKLSLLPQGAPLPYFTHVSPSVGYDVAERASRIAVSDGSLRQPLLDYLMQTGQNESYDQRGTENPAGVAGAGKYLDFNVAFSGDRMIEMKHATIQAEMRRRVGGGDIARMTALQEEGGKLLGGKPNAPNLLSRGSSSSTSHPNSSFQDAEKSRRYAMSPSSAETTALPAA
mmetsp:Transcript_144228/g.401921  ORF Transcript_144228/g.401921 Transcript_144228/m.401921 type:complete len:349 (-) Transcript_144228:243-1289(-)